VLANSFDFSSQLDVSLSKSNWGGTEEDEEEDPPNADDEECGEDMDEGKKEKEGEGEENDWVSFFFFSACFDSPVGGGTLTM
jgi:hypothetical protein